MPSLPAVLPIQDCEANGPAEPAKVLKFHEGIQRDAGKPISIADLIVLGGGVGIEQAAKAAGKSVTVPFAPGRTDATAEQTDAASFDPLEPQQDGFRHYLQTHSSVPPEELLIHRAQLPAPHPSPATRQA